MYISLILNFHIFDMENYFIDCCLVVIEHLGFNDSYHERCSE